MDNYDLNDLRHLLGWIDAAYDVENFRGEAKAGYTIPPGKVTIEIPAYGIWVAHTLLAQFDRLRDSHHRIKELLSELETLCGDVRSELEDRE